MSTHFTYLALGLFSLLALASIIGFCLKHKIQGESGQRIVSNLNARTNAWWVMVILLLPVLMAGQTITTLFFALLSFLALREFVTVTPTARGDHFALSLAFFITLPLQYYLVLTEWYSLFTILIPVYAFLLLPIVSVSAEDTSNFLERTAKIQWGLMITVYCISHVPALLMLDIPGFDGRNALLLFYLLIVAQISDVLQYTFGMLFGKHKVAPIVSPNKTLEGLIGGGISATAIGAALYWITPFTPLESAGMAGLIVMMGFWGGLVMSAIKRSLGVKDWGVLVRGHGGLLDRLDSVCFSAPIFFHVLRYFYT